jgi:hypothetical protein
MGDQGAKVSNALDKVPQETSCIQIGIRLDERSRLPFGNVMKRRKGEMRRDIDTTAEGQVDGEGVGTGTKRIC